MKRQVILITLTILSFGRVFSQNFIREKNEAGAFPIVSAAGASGIYTDKNDHAVVQRAAALLQEDIERVSGKKPVTGTGLPSAGKNIIVIGSLDGSSLIGRLVNEKKLNTDSLKGKWEAYQLQVVPKPFPGVNQALVIVGSDRRGTAYGVFELSRQMGVSPWYWWADVPVRKKAEVYVKNGSYFFRSPVVKYRGIFINDEAPALTNWSKEKFGGYNHRFYEKVFELILRMKGNYLWPAMWGSAFNDDDSLNPKTADEFAIVMGTSHHEPMVRAHDEWRRYGSGKWNYDSNEVRLKEFWKKGISRMGTKENIVTIGMRGDGDEPMTQGTAIALLERIVKDQRQILGEVTGKDPSATPQIWALYKEVQDYYDKGMRVPDDVTLLLCDDNWGNIRKLPKRGEKPRPGGYGIYYHYDYVGGPRNYKWINTNQIERTWEQMRLAWQYGADRIWIVNVGDIKPMEFPIQFFLDYAWDPAQWPADRLDDYYRQWAAFHFGEKHAADIAHIVATYSRYNSRRKPELLSPDTYSLVHYREAERVVSDYNSLKAKAEKISNELPAAYRDAYYQLVLHPVEASANLNQLYVTVGRNRLYARQGRSATNLLADSAKALYVRDSLITIKYHTIAGGKWNHMMDQTHIGYTYWQQPLKNAMPEVKTLAVPAGADMGVAIEGSDTSWPNTSSQAVLPRFNSYLPQAHYIDVFNRGRQPFDYTAKAGAPYVTISPKNGRVEKEQRLWVTVDWTKAPKGKQVIPITLTGANGSSVVVHADLYNPADAKQVTGFADAGGYVSMEAEHYTKAVEAPPVTWQRIANLGRTHSGITPFPVTAESQTAGGNSPRLEYQVYLSDTGTVKVHAYLSPTLTYHDKGLRYAVSIDDEAPQIINIHGDNPNRSWNEWVANNVIQTVSTHHLSKGGRHVLKFWMVDAGVVLQKLVLDAGGLKPSYLGPEETNRD